MWLCKCILNYLHLEEDLLGGPHPSVSGQLRPSHQLTLARFADSAAKKSLEKREKRAGTRSILCEIPTNEKTYFGYFSYI